MKRLTAHNNDCEFVGSFQSVSTLPKDKFPQVAVAGRSNVGKSSLLNELTGRKKLAKVSKTPGKTRSLNLFLINSAFHLVDLPGYGYAKISLAIKKSWRPMIADYLENSQTLAGLVLLIDVRREPGTEDMEMIQWLAKRGLPVIVAVTKCDKVGRDATNRKVRELEKTLGVSAIAVSVISGIGKQELQKAIESLVREYGNKKLT